MIDMCKEKQNPNKGRYVTKVYYTYTIYKSLSRTLPHQDVECTVQVVVLIQSFIFDAIHSMHTVDTGLQKGNICIRNVHSP